MLRVFKKKTSYNQCVESNIKIWDKYAKKWSTDEVTIENTEIAPELRNKYLQFLGDEWGRKDDLNEVINDFIKPYIDQNSICAEIGSGGGRVAARVAPLVEKLTCFDISIEMLKKAKKALKSFTNIDYKELQDCQFPKELNAAYDMVYSFDVFVHLDLHTIWKYLLEIKKILKPNGKVFLHTTNLKTPDGWERFSRQDRFQIVTHYFNTPDIIDLLTEKAGYKTIKRSEIQPSNFYYNRDYLFVLSLI